VRIEKCSGGLDENPGGCSLPTVDDWEPTTSTLPAAPWSTGRDLHYSVHQVSAWRPMGLAIPTGRLLRGLTVGLSSEMQLSVPHTPLRAPGGASERG
jgi:hypothetical protein